MISLDNNKIKDNHLRTIAEKVSDKLPVSDHDALYMLRTEAVEELCDIAQAIRTSMYGASTFYSMNMNLNYTNICELRCPLCAFSCDADSPEAWVMEPKKIASNVKRALSQNVHEVHIVGGLNPDLPLHYYYELVERIRELNSDLYIVGFTATEYDFFARNNDLTVKEVLKAMKSKGVNALPGGGAEIFAPHIRKRIAPDKISGKRWLEVMQTAHSVGLKSNATMLFQHIEDHADIVDHLHQLRNLQNATNGFKAFVPLPFHPDNTGVSVTAKTDRQKDCIRLFATARIYLHNFPHIKALWMYLGEGLMKKILHAGADDAGGVYLNEKIVHSAGAETASSGTRNHMTNMILEAGLIPLLSNAGYKLNGAMK